MKTIYTLWNTETKKALKQPQLGVWTTDNKMEAEQALNDMYDYIEAIGMSHLKKNIIIKEVTSSDTSR